MPSTWEQIVEICRRRNHFQDGASPTLPLGSIFMVLRLRSSAIPRFLWNSSLCSPLLSQGITERWFTPAAGLPAPLAVAQVMQGFFQCLACPVPQGELHLVLWARRGTRHAGTRYKARGLDDQAEAGSKL